MEDKITISDEEMEIEKQRILNKLNNTVEDTPIIEEVKIQKTSKFKLYLNNLINLFNNNKRKSSKVSLIQKIKIKIKLWWEKKQTEDIKDLAKFVGIHGFMGMNVILSLLTVMNVNISLVNIIKQNVLFTAMIYLIGTGGAYYLLLDLIKVVSASCKVVGKDKG
jgi:hypothetical protein